MAGLPLLVSIIEIILLLAAFASGIATAALIGMSQDDFKGDCVLYAKIEWTSPTYFQVRPASVGKCSYAIGVQSIALIAAFVYAAYRAVVLVTNRFDVPLMRIISVPVYATFAFLILVQASLVTMGIFNFCWGLQSEPTYAKTACRMFQEVMWQHYRGDRFYDLLKMAEAASWASFFFWIALLVSGIVRVVKERQYSSMGGTVKT